MRIIIITSSTNRSGGTRQAMYQADGLLARGHDVTFCLPENSTLWDLHHGESHWFRLPSRASAIHTALETLLPDPSIPTIVHAFHNRAVKRLAFWGLPWSGYFGRKRRLACVAHRGVIFRPGNPFPFLSPAMKAFIVNSQACADAMRWHCPRQKIHIVENGIPDARITPVRSPDEVRTQLGLPDSKEKWFAYVGNDNPAKGMNTLLTAFARSGLAGLSPEEGGSRLLVIGPSPQVWQPVCDELGISAYVHLVGRIEQVADCLQLCDAFIFPSNDMDSAPNTLLEAIRMGLPVIATTVGGVPEIVSGSGLLIPPRDVPALVLAMQRMAKHDDLRSLWAGCSRKSSSRFTVDARCAALETIYESLV